MPLASDPSNIRINGTGRLYASAVGSPNLGIEIGEIDGLTDSFSVEDEKIYSNRVAGKVAIGSVAGAVEASIGFGMRESSIENLILAYRANAENITSQLAGNLESVAFTMVEKEFIDVGKSDCYVTKIGHGAVTGGPLQLGENIVGGTSSATGQVAWVGAGFVELIDVSGTFASGETLTGSVSAGTATCSSIEHLADMVVCDLATATVRYVLGTDYKVDADYGLIMRVPGGAIGATAYISCDHSAQAKKTIYAMSAENVEKKFTFVTDADDTGPRMKYTYFRVSVVLNGDTTKLGDGEQVLPMTGSLMADTSRPVGQQYMMIDLYE